MKFEDWLLLGLAYCLHLPTSERKDLLQVARNALEKVPELETKLRNLGFTGRRMADLGFCPTKILPRPALQGAAGEEEVKEFLNLVSMHSEGAAELLAEGDYSLGSRRVRDEIHLALEGEPEYQKAALIALRGNLSPNVVYNMELIAHVLGLFLPKKGDVEAGNSRVSVHPSVKTHAVTAFLHCADGYVSWCDTPGPVFEHLMWWLTTDHQTNTGLIAVAKVVATGRRKFLPRAIKPIGDELSELIAEKLQS